MSPLTDQLSRLITAAGSLPLQDADRAALSEVAHRLHGPLRVAVAGKVKAGKSTLLNALVGERLAPTAAEECTKIVTWYRDGATYRVTLHPKAGVPTQVPFTRHDGALEINLGGLAAADVARLEVDWPSAALREMTLIDTPGIGTISTDIGERTHEFLTPEDAPSPTDAVIYLMRHLHANDVRLLEAFHDQEAAQPSPINSIGVLSRADEIGAGRLDALSSARRIALRYSNDPKLRRLCQTVLPIAGLLAETGVSLRQDEYTALQTLSMLERSRLDSLLVSVDRFVNIEAPDLGLTPLERTELLDRFGIFGIRLSCALLRQGQVNSASELASTLADRSGLSDLRATLNTHLSARSDVLRARSALLALERLALRYPGAGRELDVELERTRASVHEFAEIRLLNQLRLGLPGFPGNDLERAEQLLGGQGGLVHQRLGADVGTEGPTLAALAMQQHSHWQRMAENPLVSREVADAARVLIRTCEGLAAAGHATAAAG